MIQMLDQATSTKKATRTEAEETGENTDAVEASGPRRSKGLSRNAINFIVDAILLVSLMSVLFFSLVLTFVLPMGAKAAGYSIWGVDRDGWVNLLNANIYIFSVLVLLHLILHWSWVCMFVSSRLGKALGRRFVIDDAAKTVWGVAGLVAVLGVILIGIIAAEFAMIAPK